MREYLFRGKRIDTGEWVEGHYVRYIKGIEVDETPIYGYVIVEDKWHGEEIEVIPETVGQYTGLKDKNGNNIFEGDIIKIYKDLYEVIWIENIFSFKILNHSYSKDGIFHNPYLNTKDTELIGNKFDNPELLETK